MFTDFPSRTDISEDGFLEPSSLELVDFEFVRKVFAEELGLFG